MTPSSILSEFLWFNSYIKIDKKSVHIRAFSEKRLNFVGQLFLNGKLKPWVDIQSEFDLRKEQHFQFHTQYLRTARILLLKIMEIQTTMCFMKIIFVEVALFMPLTTD